MPVYRCGICNVFSSSLEQHARHLNGARHKRNEASALAGTVRAASDGAGKGAKRARRDAAAVAACLETLDGAAPAAGLPPLREWLLRRDAVRSAPRIPRRFCGDTRRYADSFRHAMAAEAFDIIDRSLGAGGEVADHDVLRVDRQQRLVVILHREHIYQDAFVRFLCGESAVALLLESLRELNRALDAGDRAAAARALGVIRTGGAAVGLFQQEPEAFLRAHLERHVEQAGLSVDEIEALIVARKEARERRDFAAADGIRDQLAEQGIVLLDSPDGTTWKRG